MSGPLSQDLFTKKLNKMTNNEQKRDNKSTIETNINKWLNTFVKANFDTINNEFYPAYSRATQNVTDANYEANKANAIKNLERIRRTFNVGIDNLIKFLNTESLNITTNNIDEGDRPPILGGDESKKDKKKKLKGGFVPNLSTDLASLTNFGSLLGSTPDPLTVATAGNYAQTIPPSFDGGLNVNASSDAGIPTMPYGYVMTPPQNGGDLKKKKKNKNRIGGNGEQPPVYNDSNDGYYDMTLPGEQSDSNNSVPQSAGRKLKSKKNKNNN